MAGGIGIRLDPSTKLWQHTNIINSYALAGTWDGDFFIPSRLVPATSQPVPRLIPLRLCRRCNVESCAKLDWCSSCWTELVSTACEKPYQVGDVQHCATCNHPLWSAVDAFDHLLNGCWHYWDIDAIPRTSKLFDPNWRLCWLMFCSAIHNRDNDCMWRTLIALSPLLRRKAGDTPPHECTEHELNREKFINLARWGRKCDWHGDRMSIAIHTVVVEIEKARDDPEHFLRTPIISKPCKSAMPVTFEFHRLANKAYSEIQKAERLDRHHGITHLPDKAKRLGNEIARRRLRRRSAKRVWCPVERRFISTWTQEELLLADDAGILDAISSREIQKQWIREKIADPLDQKIVWLRRGKRKYCKTTGWNVKWPSYSMIARTLSIGDEKVKYRLEKYFRLFERQVMQAVTFVDRPPKSRIKEPIPERQSRRIDRRIASLRGMTREQIAEVILGEFGKRLTVAEISSKVSSLVLKVA